MEGDIDEEAAAERRACRGGGGDAVKGGGKGMMKKGPWSPSEDDLLTEYVQKHGEGNWKEVAERSGLRRCGKSCRLRWTNQLRPHLRKDRFTPAEEATILLLHSIHGNKWAKISAQLPGRTDNAIKNFMNTRAKRHKRQLISSSMGISSSCIPAVTTAAGNGALKLNIIDSKSNTPPTTTLAPPSFRYLEAAPSPVIDSRHPQPSRHSGHAYGVGVAANCNPQRSTSNSVASVSHSSSNSAVSPDLSMGPVLSSPGVSNTINRVINYEVTASCSKMMTTKTTTSVASSPPNSSSSNCPLPPPAPLLNSPSASDHVVLTSKLTAVSAGRNFLQQLVKTGGPISKYSGRLFVGVDSGSTSNIVKNNIENTFTIGIQKIGDGVGDSASGGMPELQLADDYLAAAVPSSRKAPLETDRTAASSSDQYEPPYSQDELPTIIDIGSICSSIVDGADAAVSAATEAYGAAVPQIWPCRGKLASYAEGVIDGPRDNAHGNGPAPHAHGHCTDSYIDVDSYSMSKLAADVVSLFVGVDRHHQGRPFDAMAIDDPEQGCQNVAMNEHKVAILGAGHPSVHMVVADVNADDKLSTQLQALPSVQAKSEESSATDPDRDKSKGAASERTPVLVDPLALLGGASLTLELEGEVDVVVEEEEDMHGINIVKACESSSSKNFGLECIVNGGD